VNGQPKTSGPTVTSPLGVGDSWIMASNQALNCTKMNMEVTKRE